MIQVRKMKHTFLISCLAVLLFSSCGNDEKAFEERKKLESADALVAADTGATEFKKTDKADDKEGFTGVYDVPEMLALCVKDSAAEKDLALKYAQAFTRLENELNALGIKSSGAPGSIAYNNDPNNFVFECVYPIEKIPAKQPKDCQVVVLEASNMLIYNYYGEYAMLYKAYEKIREQMKKSKLEQVGPMREFYVTDPTREKDSTKWMTRIMVPVNKKNPNLK